MLNARLYKPLNEDWDSKKEKESIKTLSDYITIPSQMTEFEAFREIKNEYKQVQGPKYRNSNGKIGGTYAWAKDVLRMLFKDRVYYDTDLRTKFRYSLETFEQEMCPLKNLEGMTPQAITSKYGDLLKGYTAQDLMAEFYPIYLEKQREEQENAKKETYGRSDYTVVSVKNTKEASKYKYYTDWCVTKAQGHYDNYAGKHGRFYFLLKKGFEEVPKQKGNDYPLDEYGKSMFAVCVDSDGMITHITCRWNHGAGKNDIPNADNIITPTDLSKIVNMDVYEECKPYSKQELRAMGYIHFDEVQELLNMGEKPEDVFEQVYPFKEGFAPVELNSKFNFIDTDGNIVSDTWFDDAGYFYEGFARVKLNGKWNFIDKNGNILSNTWFDYAKAFEEGFARVQLNGKNNLIDKNGNILFKTWFDVVYDFYEGFARVKLNGKWNFIDKNGNIVSDTWFDDADDFSADFAWVNLNGKWHHIDSEGRLYDKNKQLITESFTGLQKRIYEAIQIGIRKGLRRI